MEGGHHLPVGIEGKLRRAGKLLFQCLSADAAACGEIEKSQLRGIPEPLFPFQGRIIAQSQPLQKFLVFRTGDLRRSLCRFCCKLPGVQKPLIQETFFHRHPVLGQGSRLVGADHAHRPQRLHRRKLPDDGVHPYHFRHAHGKADGDHSRKPFRHRRHGKGNGRDQHLHNVPFLNQRNKKQRAAEKQRKNA